MIRVVVWVTGERGGVKDRRLQEYTDLNFIKGVRYHWEGPPSSDGTPPPNFQVLTAAQVGCRKPLGAGCMVRESHGRPTRHWWIQSESVAH